MASYLAPEVEGLASPPPVVPRRNSTGLGITPQQPGRHLIHRKEEKSEAMQIEVPCLTCHQVDSQTVNTDVRITVMDIIDYENMEWKNKQGQTTQIAIYPTSSTPDEQFDYRISSSAITASSQFSRYPGYTRHIIILDHPISPIHPPVYHASEDPDKVDRKPDIALHHDKRPSRPALSRDEADNDESQSDEALAFFQDWHLDEKRVDKENKDYAIHHLLPFKKHRFHGDWNTKCHLTSTSKKHMFHVADFNVFTNDTACFAICDVIHLKAGGSESFVLQHETTKKHHHYIYVAETHVSVDLLAVDTSQQLHQFYRSERSITPYTLVVQQGQTVKIDSLRHKHSDGGHPNIGVHLSAPRDRSTVVIVVSIEFVDGQ